MSSRRVFISYTHSAKEKEWVRRFSDSLKDRGLSVWLDQVQIHPGDDLAGALEQGLRQSDTIVSILNQDSVNSPGTLFEMGAAFGMGKRVIPVVPEDLDLSLVPHALRTRRFLLRRSPEETAEALAEATLETSSEQADQLAE